MTHLMNHVFSINKTFKQVFSKSESPFATDKQSSMLFFSARNICQNFPCKNTRWYHPKSPLVWTIPYGTYIKDPNKSNTQKYFRHSYVKEYELALL